MVVCNGLTGVKDPDAEWSTWSYAEPDFSGCDDNEAFRAVYEKRKRIATGNASTS